MNIVEKPVTQEQEKLIQSEFNTNVAFYVHLKAFDNKLVTTFSKISAS